MFDYFFTRFVESFFVLVQSIGTIEVACFRSSLEYPIDEPLNQWEDMNEISTLNLKGFDRIWTFHA